MGLKNSLKYMPAVLVVLGMSGVLGFGALSVIETMKRPKSNAELEKTKAMLRQTFEKNKQLADEVQRLSESRVDFLKEIRDKEKELNDLNQKIQNQITLVRDLTKSQQEQTAAGFKTNLSSDAPAAQTPVAGPVTGSLINESGFASDATSSDTIFGYTNLQSLPLYDQLAATSFTATQMPTKVAGAIFQSYPQGMSQELAIEKEKKVHELEQLVNQYRASEKDYGAQIESLRNQIQTHEGKQKEEESKWANRLEEAEARAKELQEKINQPAQSVAEKKNAKKELAEVEAKKKQSLRDMKEIQRVQQKDRLIFFFNLGVAYSYAGLYQDAAEMFEKALEINPNDAPSHYNLGILFDEYLGDSKQAIGHYRAYMRLSEDDQKRNLVQGWIQMAESKRGRGRQTRIQSARRAFESLFLTSN